MTSLNYNQACEAAVQRQINLELHASYVYLSMAYYFKREDKSLPNISRFFHTQSKEECEHAEKLMSLQSKKGGKIFLEDIKKPDRDEWGCGLEALQFALQLASNVNKALLDLHVMVAQYYDPHLCDLIQSQYLDKQVQSIKQLGDWVSTLRRMGAPYDAEHLFHRHTMGEDEPLTALKSSDYHTV